MHELSLACSVVELVEKEFSKKMKSFLKKCLTILLVVRFDASR